MDFDVEEGGQAGFLGEGQFFQSLDDLFGDSGEGGLVLVEANSYVADFALP